MFVYIMVNFCGKYGKIERKNSILRFILIYMKSCKILLIVSNRDVFLEKILYKYGLYFYF